MSVVLPDTRTLFPGGVALPAPVAPVASIAPPTVAVLGDAAHGVAAACAVALALGAAAGTRCALAMAVGRGERAALPFTPAAGRGAARLRERGYDATAVGRLVWLADLRVSRKSQAGDRGASCSDRSAAGGHGADPADRAEGASCLGRQAVHAHGADPADGDPVGAVAAASLELAGAARAVGIPAAVAIPLARTAALDRVLGWHDGIVVVDDERTTLPELAELARQSLATLDRPIAAMTLPSRLQARAAVAGIGRPEAAVRAVAGLGLMAGRRR